MRGAKFPKFRHFGYILILFAVFVSARIFSRQQSVNAAACLASSITATRVSSPVFYVDSGITPAIDSGYVAYRIQTGASTSFNNLWVKAGSFSDPTKLTLAPNEDGNYQVGATAVNTTKFSYFYLKGTVAKANTPEPAQNYVLTFYEGNPASGGVINCTINVSNTGVEEIINASANKINSVVTTTPYLGSQITMTVNGDTGTIGSTKLFTYTPASTSGWLADCFVLKDVALSYTGGNTGSLQSNLFINFPNSATTNYTIVYTFDVRCDLATVTPITPKSDINSGGTNVKHTDTGTATYQAIASITPTQKSVVVSKSVSPPSVYLGASTPSYTITLTNTGPNSVTIDSIRDTLPNSPATVTYNTGTSIYNGSAYANPSIVGQTLTWTGPFTIPAGSSRNMLYTVSVPATIGTYSNSAVAFISNLQIDTTNSTSDNSPATTKYYVGIPDFSTSSKEVSDLNGGTTKPSDILRYTITIRNTGTGNGTLVNVTDTIDTDTQNLTNVTTSNCGSTTNSSTSTQLNLSNVTVTTLNNCIITFDVTVKTPLNENTAITNTATISGGEQNGTGASPSSTTLFVDATPNLVVSKTANVVSTTVVHEQVINYTIAILNNGDGQGSGISLSDPIDSDVNFNPASLIYTDCGSPNSSYSAPNLSITNITINAGISCHIQYQATVKLTALHNDLVTNGVDVSGATEGGNNPNVTNAVDLTIDAAPNLSTSTKSVSDLNGGVVEPGDTLRYTVWIINTDTGPGSGIPLTDTIDTDTENLSNVTFQNCGSPVNNSTSTNLNIVNITAYVDIDCRVTFDVTVKTNAVEGAPITNTAYIGQAFEGGATTNPSSTTLYVDTTPVVTIVKTDDDADNVVDLLQTVTYTLTLSNTGNGPGTTTVTDTVTGSVSNISNVQLTDCGGSSSTTIVGKQLTITGVIVGISSGCVITYQVTVNSDALGLSTITNTADATAPTEGGSNPSPSSADTLYVHEDPLLAVTKTDNDVDNSVTPGQTVLYTVSITNSGNAGTVTSLTDTLTDGFGTPFDYNYTNCGIPNSSFTDPEISITNISIAIATTCEITYKVQIDSPLNEGTTLGNSVDVIRADATKGNDPDPVSADTLTIDATPELSTSTKTVEDLNGGEVALGDTLRYTITLINSGNGQGTDISITDPIDDDTENLSIFSITNCGPGYDGSTSSTVQILSITVDVGTNCVVVYEVDVTMTALEGAEIPNTADVSPAQEGGASTYPSSTTLYVNVTPEITITKTDDDADNTVDPSQTILYTVTLTNSASGLGTTNLTDTVTGPVSNITNVVVTNCGSSYANSTIDKSLNITSLEVTNGTDCVVTYEVTVNSGALGGETVNNTADASAPTEGGSDPSPSSADTLTVRDIPVLEVTKSEDDADNIVAPGQTVTYTVTIRNLGNATGNTSFTDTISDYVNAPTNFTYSSCGSASESYASPTLTVSNITVTTANDCIVTYDVEVKSPLYAPLTISNSVDVSASTEGSNDPAPVSADDLNVQVTPVFTSSTKTVSDVNGAPLLPGDTLHYVITIINTGDGKATGVSLSDTIDSSTEGIANISIADCGSSYVDNSTSTAISIDDLEVAVGTNCVVGFDVNVKPDALDGTELNNQATIGAADEGGSGSNPSSDPITVDTTPGISLNKTEDDADNIVDPGQQITYTLTLSNSGDGKGTVSLTDSVTGPTSDIYNLTITDCGSSYTNNTSGKSLDISSIQVSTGINCVVTYSVDINAGALGNAVINNTADATAPSEGGSDPSSSSADTLTVRNIPVLEVTKSEDDSDNYVVPGQTVRYAVTIKNTGNATGHTSFTDTISEYVNSPSNFTYTGCGSSSEVYSSPTLTVSNITVTTSNDCVVEYDVEVKSPLSDTATITNSVDVAAADEGGTDPSPVSATTLSVVVTPLFSSSTKTVEDLNGGAAAPNDVLRYTITIKNTGNGTATGVSLIDNIDTDTENLANVTFNSCGGAYTDSSTSNKLDITNLTIEVGTDCLVIFEVNVVSTALEGAEIVNTADIGPANEGGSGYTTPQTKLLVDIIPILGVTVSENDADNNVIRGQIVTYTITISNTGNANAPGVNLISQVTGPTGNVGTVNTQDCGASVLNGSTAQTLSLTGLVISLSTPCVITFTVTVNSNASYDQKILMSVDVSASADGGNDPSAIGADTLTVQAPEIVATISLESARQVNITEYLVTYLAKLESTGTLPVQNAQISMPLDSLLNGGDEVTVVDTELIDSFVNQANLNASYNGLSNNLLIAGGANTGVVLDARGGNTIGVIRVTIRIIVPYGENIPDLSVLGSGSDLNTNSNLVNVVFQDEDKDGFNDTTESNTNDRDGDGVVDSEDFDPQGVFYCTDNGKIIPGGKIAVTGPGRINIVADGSNGNYQWFASGTPGVYEMTLTAPAGTEIATELINTGILDPTGKDNPYSIGSNQYQQSGKLANFTKEANPVYLKFDIASGDPWIINNNIPLKNCGALALTSIQNSAITMAKTNPRRLIIIGAVLLAALAVVEIVWRRRAMEKPVKPGKKFIVAAGNPRRIISRKHGIDNYIEKLSGDKLTDRTTTSSIHYAGWLKKTAKPGDKGLSIIGGHVYGKHKNGVFFKLNEFEKDDVFEVEFGNGSIRKFIVESVRLVKPADVKRAVTTKDKDIEKQVNLITFADRYDKKTRYTQERVLVIGRYDDSDEENTL